MSEVRSRLRDALASSWAAKARPSQRLPVGDWWSIWLLMSGRGWGKSRTLSEVCNSWAISGEYRRIAVVASTASDARDVMIEGESGILSTAPDWCRPIYQPTRRRLVWPNDAVAYTYSAEEPERLRGPQHEAAICDELASWSRPETFDMLMFGLRLGRRPRTVIGTTPRPTKLVRSLVAREGHDVIITRGSSYENKSNLAPQFFSQIVAKYEGTRLGRQELYAELLEDVPGALWSIDMIDRARRVEAPDLERIVIGIDPAVSTKEHSDLTGIVVVGRCAAGHGWVLEDLSGKYQPAEWARIAIDAFRRHGADRIVAEINQGGDLVEATLRMIDPNIPFTAVHASRGKYTRAEPCAALYEQGKVHHVGTFALLEEQMTTFVPDIDRAKMGSPDRLDSLVWGLSELLVQQEKYAGLLQWYELEAAKAEALASDNVTMLPEQQTPSIPGELLDYEPADLENYLPIPTMAKGGGMRLLYRRLR